MKRRLLLVLALALLAFPAASPYFWPGVPRTNDLAPHLFRTFFFDRALAWNGWWPRWSPDLVYGYGYPVFDFFPSLFHAVTDLWHRLGLPLLTAYRVTTYLHFWLAALGSYLLGRTVSHSPAGGWAAALVYTYSPYLLYDAHMRGAGPEMQALALLPLLVLALWRAGEQRAMDSEGATSAGSRSPDAPQGPLAPLSLRRSLVCSLRSPWWMLATAGLFALTLLSHYPVVYQISIPIGLWLLLRALLAARNGRFWVPLVGPLLGIGLGGLLAAFFWLPALAEMPFVRAQLSISQGYSYQGNFLSLVDMLRWPRIPADPSLVNPPVVRALPVVGLLCAGVGLLWRRRRLHRPDWEVAASWTAVLLLCIWLITPASRFVWESFPLLRLTLYPWRLLSMASLAAAVMAALALKGIRHGRLEIRPRNSPRSPVHSLWLPFFLTIVVITAGIPWLYPPRQSLAERVDLTLALADEAPPLLIGTTTLGEFLPRWVTELPPQQPARSALIADDNPDRLQAVEGLTWTRQGENPLDALYTIRANHPLTLTYGQFYFPGWRATLDGAEAAISPSQPYGLMTLAVSAGEHELRLTFGRTPARAAGELTSAAALVAALIVAFAGLRNVGRGLRNLVGPPAAIPYPQLFLGLTAVSLWLFFTLVDTPLRRETLRPDGVLGRPVMAPLDYAGELRLLTFEQSATAVSAADRVCLTLYWQPQREIGVPYAVGVQVRDAEGKQWQASVDRPPDWRFIGSDPWPLDGYRLEPFEVTLADGTPPGTYHFHVGLVRADTGQTVAAHDLGSFQVAEPAQGERPLEEGMTAAAEAAVYGDLRLLGTRVDRQEGAPGGIVRVTALWQVTEAPVLADTFTLQLVGDGGVALSQRVTLAPNYPLAEWRPGDRLRSETILRLPAGLASGAYTWQIRWGGRQINAGSLGIMAPERIFSPPPVELALNEAFGDLATLLGVNFTPAPALLRPSEPLDLTLVWRAERETATDYHVFVHLIDADGDILTQSDGEPAEWTRPTTGWLPGEIILDHHSLALPAGTVGPLWLRVGLYDAEGGQRLPTANGEFVLIPLRP
jgi:hypothetical protein